MAPRRLADHEPGVIPDQCSSCGDYGMAEWSVTVVHDPTPDMRGCWRLCDTCYRSMMTLLTNPASEHAPLRGYR